MSSWSDALVNKKQNGNQQSCWLVKKRQELFLNIAISKNFEWKSNEMKVNERDGNSNFFSKVWDESQQKNLRANLHLARKFFSI